MVVVFSGPTLSPEAAHRLFPGARCEPPAAQGDVYRACRSLLPAAICLIDGYFEHQPAVTHKELLWAMHQGVLVYGAASMGALRAAELAAFGMRGWGKVYEMFAAGDLEDDDEVTVVHADSDREFAPSSEALVNVRLTLKSAVAEGVVSSTSADALVARAKALFYPDRQYPRLLREAAEAGVSRSEVLDFERWLEASGKRVDQKASDASTLLVHVRTGYETRSLPSRATTFDFPYTEAWHELRMSIEGSGPGQRAAADPAPQSNFDEGLLEEIQLLGPEPFQQVLSAATWRALCLELDGTGDSLLPEARPATHAAAATQLDRVPARPSREWLSEHDLDPRSHRRLVEDEHHVARVNVVARRRVLSQIRNVLTLLGDYPKVRKRAREKHRETGPPDHRLDASSVADAVRYYFEDRLGRSVPENLTAFARATGFASREELLVAICRDAEFMRRH